MDLYRMGATGDEIIFSKVNQNEILVEGKSLDEIHNILLNLNENRKNIEYEQILTNDFLKELNKIIVGSSLTYPEGWIYKKDLLELIDKLNWR